MSGRGRRVLLVALGAVSPLVVAAALAWACTPAAFTHLTPTSAPPGSKITVRGEGFIEGPVQIRWASTGAVLATATGPAFSAVVTIPADAPKGVHYIESVAETDGAVAGRHIRALQVSAPPAANAKPVSKPEPEPRSAPAPRPGPRAERAPAPAAAPAPTPAAAAPAPSPAAATADPSPRAAAAEATPPPESTGEPAAASAPAERASNRAERGARTEPSEAPAPSERSAVGDPWTGVASGERAWQTSSVTAAPATPDGANWELLVGAAMLAAGLVTLMAGAAAALRRRRPAG